MADDQSYGGQAQPGSDTNRFNSVATMIDLMVGRRTHMYWAQVQKNTNTPGQVAAVGQVNVLPLANQVDGNGKAVPHTIVNQIPYMRFGGGKNAILVDPEPGDFGIVLVADRDSTGVRAKNPAGTQTLGAEAQANPGSGRQNDMADGVFIGVHVGPQPEQYFSATPDGIIIRDKHNNIIQTGEGGILLNGVLITPGGDVVTAHGTSLDSHVNTGVAAGGDNSGPPP